MRGTAGSGVQVFDDGAAQHLARILGVLVRGGTLEYFNALAPAPPSLPPGRPRTYF